MFDWSTQAGDEAFNPVATEAGRLVQTVTFVEPAIGWADGRGYDSIAQGLRVLQSGVPVGSSQS